MRPATLRKIDALHAQINNLIEREKRYYDKQHPDDNELWRHVAHTKIELARHCRQYRAAMVESVASINPQPPRGFAGAYFWCEDDCAPD